jgi:hypothetical protein
MLSNRRAYDRMTAEYRARFPGSDHPKKISVPIRHGADGLIEAYVNSMFARLADGTFGAKTVYVDETAGTLSAATTVFDGDGDLEGMVDSAALTADRCGLMTAFAIDQAFDCTDYSKMILGLVGVGRINLAVARMLHEILGIRRFMLKHGPTGKTRGLGVLIPGDTLEASAYHQLSMCDVVVSCTTNANRDTMMKLPDPAISETRLYIAHDGGWLFDESFREHCIAYADHPQQIDAAHDFPFDEYNPLVSAIFDLNALHGQACSGSPAIVYLSGMAMSDVIMAQEQLRGGAR